MQFITLLCSCTQKLKKKMHLESLLLLVVVLFYSFISEADGQSSLYQAKATFSEYAKGYMKIINGHIIIDLDVSDISVGDETSGIPSNCFSNGVYYHIHTEWNHNDMLDKEGTVDCSNTSTGGHWDPWFACSENSAGVDCEVNGGCITPSSIIELNGSYDCDSDSWESHPFACEVSDFTGKYGKASVSSLKIDDYSSHWLEIDPQDIPDDYSVVFHCSDDSKTRAFCAPLNITQIEDYDDYSRQTGSDSASLNFNDLTANGFDFDGLKVEIGQGYVNVDLPSEVGDACEAWTMEIREGWMHSSSQSKHNENCNYTYTGYIWDPTHSCIENSASPYCDDGTRCPGKTATDVNYDCDLEEDALKCAHGDITGRIDKIEYPGGGTYRGRFDDRISMAISLLDGKSLVMLCDDNGDIAANGIYAICTPIQSSDLSLASNTSENGELTAGGVFAIIVVILLIIGIGIAYFYGKSKQDSKDNNQNNDLGYNQQIANQSMSNMGMVKTVSESGYKNNQNPGGESYVNSNTSTPKMSLASPEGGGAGVTAGGAGELPPKPISKNQSPNFILDEQDPNLEVGNENEDNSNVNVMAPSQHAANATLTKLPPAPPRDQSARDINIDLDRRESTPEQPEMAFENVAGSLPIDELGSPKM